MLEEIDTDETPLSTLRAARKAQLTQIAAMKSSIESAKTAQKEALSDLRNLEYVTELTRDEIASRLDGNECLEKAYSGMDLGTTTTNDVQRIEAELLVARSELSLLRLSIDQLHAQKERMSLSPPARPMTSLSGSCGGGTGRLIADVDVCVVANQICAPGRVGVAPTGTLSLLGYDSADALRKFDPNMFDNDESCPIVELSKHDELMLQSKMKTANVDITVALENNKGDNANQAKVEKIKATIVGIADAVHATATMVNATLAATTVGEQPLSPVSPRLSRRPLSEC